MSVLTSTELAHPETTFLEPRSGTRQDPHTYQGIFTRLSGLHIWDADALLSRNKLHAYELNLIH